MQLAYWITVKNQKPLKKMTITFAKKVLKSWVHGFNTNNWNDYIQLLSDDYVFDVPENNSAPRKSINTALELFMTLKKMGVHKITKEPIRITSNDETVVFEFQEPFADENNFSWIGFALSFDCKNGSITTCREYYQNNIDQS